MIRTGSIVLAAVVGAGGAPPVVEREVSAPVTNVTREELEKIPGATSIEDLIRRCPARTIPTVETPSPPTVPGANRSSVGCVQPDDLRMIDIYREHNRVRDLFGARPLVWDPQLVFGAEERARTMARTGQFIHAPRAGRGTVRENIARVPIHYSPSQMIAGWLAERADFVPGVFPNVCRSGGDCGGILHFSQMLWPTTTNIGCGAAIGGGSAWLVCRYNPGGNKDGKPVGVPIQDSRRIATLACRNQGGIMMCPGPEGGGAAQGGQEDRPQGGANDGGGEQAGGGAGGTRTRDVPTPPVVDPESGIGGGNETCSVRVIAKVLIPTGRKDKDGNPIYKETHNLDHGFTEVVIPHGFEAKGDFRPHAGGTHPYDGTMTATWGMTGARNPFRGTVTGDRAKLARGRWDDTDGVVKIDPGPNRPVVQNHEINAHWVAPTHGVECSMPQPFRFVVTFAAEVPFPDALNLEKFVNDADRAGFPGTRPRRPFGTGTRAFHTAPPQPVRRGDYVLVPVGILWDLPETCCDIPRAEREVIQFARAAISGPNGRQGKGWGLDIRSEELDEKKKAKGEHDPVYTGHPDKHGKDKPTEHGPGGARSNAAGDVQQWDAPGMPKDLFDRLLAAQDPSEYRQQFLSLLVCRPPGGESRVGTHLTGSKVCQVAIMTVRWNFQGQRGVVPTRPRGGGPLKMRYRPPIITISFDVRDGNCRPLSEFLEQNGFLDAFRNPSSDARKLEILPDKAYRDLGNSVDDWEDHPFDRVRIQPRAQ